MIVEHSFIKHYAVHNIGNACRASGNPKRIEFGDPYDTKDSDVERMERLARAPIGSGHDVALRGIIVHCSLFIKQNIHKQLLRYSNVTVVSSMSIEVCAAEFLASDWHMQLVDPFIRDYLRSKADIMPREWLVDNMPAATLTGLTIVTNYAQLKTIYAQRKNHRNPGWKPICKWMEGLPYSHMITGETHANP
jgi:hypothetical protein